MNMLKHIGAWCDDGDNYEKVKAFYTDNYNRVYRVNNQAEAPDKTVKKTIMTFHAEDFDEETMDKLIMLISGMLWAIEHGGIADDDPKDLAYNVWLAIKDFSTGDYDDLFTPEDLALVKQDIRTLLDYFDAHPSLKGE